MPVGYTLFSAVAGGVAGAIVMVATSHLPGLIAALLVFGASCGSYSPEAEADGPLRHGEQLRRESNSLPRLERALCRYTTGPRGFRF